MAIEEKPRALEFTFVPDNLESDLKYEITYDESSTAFPLRISAGGQAIDYPLELLTEIVEFLTSKGVIESAPTSLTTPTPGRTATIPGPILPQISVHPTMQPFVDVPVPQISKRGGSAVPQPPMDAPQTIANIDPLASFDITTPASTAASQTPPSSIPIPVITTADSAASKAPPIPSLTTAKKKVSVEALQEMNSRPVIRSRVTKGDPQSAEREAALLRASQRKGGGKTIKKAHRPEGY